MSGAYHFDSEQRLVIDADLPDFAGDFTIAGWLRYDVVDPQWSAFFHFRQDDPSYDLYFGTGPSRDYMWAYFNGESCTPFNLKISPERWYHVGLAVSRTAFSTDALIHVVDFSAGRADFASTHWDSDVGPALSLGPGKIYLGHNPFGENQFGSSSMFRIWQAALTADELRREANRSAAARAVALYGDWSLDGPSGLVSNGHAWHQDGTEDVPVSAAGPLVPLPPSPLPAFRLDLP